ncbi:hypothetical protein D9758_003907 [Tetrapyrgos nigripes]|uniref:Uncharacterized protein n=1 Tax=Tetrapyrgos nigripes TaxID=182062 RepID=A0A8H5GKY7_9AGAR|nr:hypothetical protein D9758_003907 [Tetrapyrgos nigripes]
MLLLPFAIQAITVLIRASGSTIISDNNLCCSRMQFKEFLSVILLAAGIACAAPVAKPLPNADLDVLRREPGGYYHDDDLIDVAIVADVLDLVDVAVGVDVGRRDPGEYYHDDDLIDVAIVADVLDLVDVAVGVDVGRRDPGEYYHDDDLIDVAIVADVLDLVDAAVGVHVG